MIKKKVCLIGAYAVGKTSLVRKFVSGIFSDDYLTTVGVKIDQRTVSVDDRDVKLMIWDLAGRDEFQTVRKSYLLGATGFLFVADGTRAETLDAVREELEEIRESFSGMPSLLLINKSDLTDEWEVDDEMLAPFREENLEIFTTSAKSGDHVEEAFDSLTRLMLDGAK